MPELGLNQVWLVAGCLFQTVWNLRSGQPAAARIAAYDVFYFDPADLSSAAEEALRERARRLFAALGVTVELCNQARVHLWYEAYFGHPYPPLESATAGIDRFLVLCTRVGLRPAAGRVLEIYAPNGLHDLYAGVLRRNLQAGPVELFRRKAASYVARWDGLTVWEDESAPP